MTSLRTGVNFQLGGIPFDSDPSECIADPELAYKVGKRSQLFKFNANAVLFRQGDPPNSLYLVKNGEVDLTMRVAGRIVVQIHAGPGSLVGLPAVIGKKPYTMSAHAAGRLEVFRLGLHEFEELIEAEPQLSLSVLRILATEVRSARGALSALADISLPASD